MTTQIASPKTKLFQVDPAKYAARLTTTLNRLRKAGACEDRYKHLLRNLGGVSFDHDAPINLLSILELNGLEDCIWALCATEQNCDTIGRLFAADCAEAVLQIYEHQYPNDDRARRAIDASRRYAVGDIDSTARAAAWAAARDAAWAAAGAAARDAAWAAQEIIIRRCLLPEVPEPCERAEEADHA